jgi:acid ceramidase
MMPTHTLEVDLSLPPSERWVFSKPLRRGALALLDVYKRDLGISATQASFLIELARSVLPQEFNDEMLSVANDTGLSLEDVALGNLYYDALKVIWGCTAFAVDTPAGPLHGRNLDWWTSNGLLSTETLITRFRNGPVGPFMTVGWPGFVGALSGVAPGRFSLSLNSVISGDSPEVALPVVALLRLVLQEEPTFDAAVARLSETPIASDAIVMVVGTKEGEMVVVERTPLRHAIRRAVRGAIRATNDYRELVDVTEAKTGAMQQTSCDRFDRIGELLGVPPASLEQCIAALADPGVKMGITVQQMAFHPASDGFLIRVP